MATEDRDGRYQLATEGTLYLKAIDALPLPLQSSLLRAIDSGSVRRLGDKLSLPVDVRIIASSESDLESLVADKMVQSDFGTRFAHLVSLPSLRERRDDIPGLARYFAAQTARHLGLPRTGLTEVVEAALAAQDLPGNLPQLRALVEQAVIASGGADLEPQHLVLAEAIPV